MFKKLPIAVVALGCRGLWPDAWRPAIAPVALPGSFKRLADVDKKERSYRYTLISGLAASHYSDVNDVKPRANAQSPEGVEFLANNQPDIAVDNGVEID